MISFLVCCSFLAAVGHILQCNASFLSALLLTVLHPKSSNDVFIYYFIYFLQNEEVNYLLAVMAVQAGIQVGTTGL